MRLFVLALSLAVLAPLAVAETVQSESSDKKFLPLPALEAPSQEDYSLLNKESEGQDAVSQSPLMKSNKPVSRVMNANCKLTGRYRICF